MNEIDPQALFRFSVLGPLISQRRLPRGELQKILRELVAREYIIPGSDRRVLGEKTIEGWYYRYRAHGRDGLIPKMRADRGQSKIPAAVQTAILAAKRENPRRSIRQIQRLLEVAGTVARGTLSRSSIHRLLQQHDLSRIAGSASLPEERRSFVAAFAGEIWYGDVMHGPQLPISRRLGKSYLVSLLDDASRLVAHGAFCRGEAALDIEGVLKQAVLKRGHPGQVSRSGRPPRSMRSPIAIGGGASLIHFSSGQEPEHRAESGRAGPCAVLRQAGGLTMELQHFGLRHQPLGKESTELWDDGMLARLHERFQWLLQSPGVGLLTGEAGVGKTAALRALTAKLNPHRHQVIYHAETDFGRLDLYRCLAQSLGLAPSYRRALLWREIKAHIHHLADAKQILPVWILDEAQNLSPDFFRDFPAFLNFAFDSRDLMTVWLVGHPVLAQTLERAPYAALAGRIQVRVRLTPVFERERFARLIEHGFKRAGCTQTLLSDSGLETLRQASKGLPRHAARILRTAMRLAVPRGLNHLPDDLLQLAIEELR